jgi:hypothetical protein
MNKKVHDRAQFEFCLQGLKKNATELDEMVKAVGTLLNENDVSLEKVEMSSHFQKYIAKPIRNLFYLKKQSSKGIPYYHLLRYASLFLGSAWTEKIERIINLK